MEVKHINSYIGNVINQYVGILFNERMTKREHRTTGIVDSMLISGRINMNLLLY